jgi:hypothetical protein
LVDRCRNLASIPGVLGSARPELEAGIRSFPHRGYLIFFRYRGRDVEIVRLMEGHRDLEAGFGGDRTRKTDRLCRRPRYRRRRPTSSPAPHHLRIIIGFFPHHRRVVGAADAPAGSAPLAKVKRALTARA